MHVVITFQHFDECPQDPGLRCPLDTFGPFNTDGEAREFIGTLDARYRPTAHIATISAPPKDCEHCHARMTWVSSSTPSGSTGHYVCYQMMCHGKTADPARRAAERRLRAALTGG